MALRNDLLDALNEMPPAVDLVNYYRLLQKYIQHIKAATGFMTFTEAVARSNVPGCHERFTDTEWAELQRLAAEEPR